MSSENTIETLWPTERKPTRKVGGFDIRISTQTLDNENHTEIVAIDAEDQSIHTACRVIVSDNGRRELFAGFSISGYDVAVPADIDPQETVNRAMKTVLCEEFDEATDLTNSLDDAWSRSKTYLQNRWAENEESGVTVEHFSILRTVLSAESTLAEKKTLLGSGDFFGVRKREGKYRNFDRLNPRFQERIRPPTQEFLAKIDELSGHEKLKFLRREKTQEYVSALSAFNKSRKGNRRDFCSTITLRTNHAIGTKTPEGIKINFSHGDMASIRISPKTGNYPAFSVRLTSPQIGGNFYGWVGNAHPTSRFSEIGRLQCQRSDALDYAIVCVVEMILSLDKPLPATSLPENIRQFDPNHPLLEGFSIPPRHQPLVGLILGTPYENESRRLAQSALFDR
ncbi:MAG: hypothetical protein AAGE89_06985 [Pseudomonadota bacterium]